MKHVEKQPDFVWEIDCTTSSNVQRTRNRHNVIATFVHWEKLFWSLFGQSPNDSNMNGLCVDVCGFKIIVVYKPPPSRLTSTAILMLSHPCLYAGDFNCQHTSWGYDLLSHLGSRWQLILLYDPKGPACFLSGHWGSETNPDLAFASSSNDDQLPCRRVLEKFPRFQHRPSLITSTRLANHIPS